MLILLVGHRHARLPHLVYHPVETIKQLDEIEAETDRNSWILDEQFQYLMLGGAYFVYTGSSLSTTEIEDGFTWRKGGTLISGDPWPVSSVLSRANLKYVEFVTRPYRDASKANPFMKGSDGKTAEIIRQCDIVSLDSVTPVVKQSQRDMLDGRML